MTSLIKAGRLVILPILLAGISLFLLQGCRQNEEAPPETAVSTATINPTPASSAANQSIIVAPTATSLPLPATATPLPVSTTLPPSPTPSSQDTSHPTIGYSVQNRPIIAYLKGAGTKKLAFIGGGEMALSWVSYYEFHRETIPPDLTLLFVPDPNPDNADPNSPINANGVNIFQNADGRFVNCPEQESTPETGGPYPFSEPESRALRDLLSKAWIVVLLTADSNVAQPGGCGQAIPANALVSTISDSAATSGMPLPKGHLVDYLAGEGTAAALVSQDEMSTAVIDTLLQTIDEIIATDAEMAGGNFQWVHPDNSGVWLFPTGTLIHPLSVEIIGQSFYILDSGLVQRINRQSPAMPEVILAPDDEVAGVRVIEPIDIATDGQNLLVLDRAGDVYGFDPTAGAWSLRRYDRPVSETSSHYYVALASQTGLTGQHYLLEGSYHFALQQQAERPDFIWPLPEDHQIDITVNGSDVYVASQSPISQTAALVHYQDGTRDNVFFPRLSLHRPRQIQAVGSAVYVLDNDGRRLTAIDAATGQLNSIYLPADGRPWSAFLVDAENGRIYLAAKDRIVIFGAPQERLTIPGTGSHLSPQIHDPQLLESLRGLLMPIGGSDITLRENQMPGAPRHYRLGVHEGADFYWQSGTPVRAVAAGTVIRATIDYEIPTQEMFASWGFRVQTLGYTSAEAHDFYRGMQVWIEHEGGLISRYVHLSAIDSMIREGVPVQAGQIIGAVGNTGSPVSLEGPDTDAHLHFELWLNEHYLGQFLRPIETREWLAIILNEQ